MNTATRRGFSLAGLALLVACGGDGDGTGPNGITVTGLVQDRVGEPISGATVLVANKSAVTSGSDGRFTIPDVKTPYDITVLLSSQNTAVVYTGLTRPDPSILYVGVTGPEQTATVSGVVPPALDKATLVFFISGRHGVGGARADPTTGQYGFTVSWNGSRTTLSGQLYVLQFTPGPTSFPASYDGYASRPLTISAGGAAPGNDFAANDLTDPPEQRIGGAVARPAGYTLTMRRLFVFFGRVPVVWDETGSLPDAFEYTVPAVDGLVYGVATWAVDPSSRSSFFFARRINPSADGISIPLEAAAQLASPVNGASGVDVGTPFTWSEGGGTGVNLVQIVPNNSADPTFFVLTSAAEAKMPDLSRAGMGLPASAGYQWLVDRIFPVASVDEAAGPDYAALVDFERGGGVGETLSSAFGFTTKGAASPAPSSSVVGPSHTAATNKHPAALIFGSPAVSASRRTP